MVVMHFKGAGDENIIGMGAVNISFYMKFHVPFQKEIDFIQIVMIMKAEFAVIMRRIVDGVNEFITGVFLFGFPSVKSRDILIDHFFSPCRSVCEARAPDLQPGAVIIFCPFFLVLF